MRKNIWLYLLVLLVVACESDGELADVTTVSREYIVVTPNLSLLGDGQTSELNISSNCSWTITNAADWLTVTPANGNNDATVKVAAAKNTTGRERMATLTVRGGNAPARTVAVVQAVGSEEPVAKTLGTTTTALSFAAAGETLTFAIASNTSWSVYAPEWCSLSASSGEGDGEIAVTASENQNTEQRTGQIVISGNGVNAVIIRVTQEAKVVTTPDKPGKDDNLPPS